MTSQVATAAQIVRKLLRVGMPLGVVAAAGAGLSALGTKRWQAKTRSLAARLAAARIDARDDPPRATPRVTHFDRRELVGLPEPVVRFFRTVLTDGQPMVERADIEMTGRLNLSATGVRWKPLAARQSIVAHRPGFVWDARVMLFPGVALQVVDAYLAGLGVLDVAALGLFPVASLEGGGEMARAELIRCLAELAWLPTALLPSQGVHWESIDDRAASATLIDGPLSATLQFRFSAAGPIESMRADARAASVGKQVIMMPWEGRWSNYENHHGMRVPMRGEAAWLRPEGRRSYFVGTVTAIDHAFAREHHL